MALVGVDKVAHALNLKSARRVQQLVDLGMPREARGRYDLAKCVFWYIRYLQRELERRGANPTAAEEPSTSLRAERQRLVKAQADYAEFELAQKRREYMPVAMYRQRLCEFTSLLSQRVFSLKRIATQLEGEDRTAISNKLDQAIRGLLTSISTGDGDGSESGAA